MKKIIFLTKNVGHFPGIYYGRYTLVVIIISYISMDGSIVSCFVTHVAYVFQISSDLCFLFSAPVTDIHTDRK